MVKSIARYLLWLAAVCVCIKPLPVSGGNIYDRRRMNQIAGTLIDLKSHLTNEQAEYIKPIKQKVGFLNDFLSIFHLFTTKYATNHQITNIVASNVVESLQHSKNVVVGIVKIQLNAQTSINSKTIIYTLINQLRNLVAEHQVRLKRKVAEVFFTDEWSGYFLQIRKLSTSNVLEIKSTNKRNSTHSLVGQLETNGLVFRNLAYGDDGENSMTNNDRSKRSLVLQLDQPKVFVKSINSIDWFEFLNAVFRKGTNPDIAGNLIFSKSINAQLLIIDEIANGSPITDLMTTESVQSIQSNIYVSQLFTDDFNAKIINNMKYFAENIVLMGHDNVIESRVNLNLARVNSLLRLSDDEGESMTERIVGTHIDDLTQIYNGKIRIKGSAEIDKIYVDQEEQVHVNDIRLEITQLSQQYWMKKLNQDFKHVTFIGTIENSQAMIEKFNGIKTGQYFFLSDSVDHDDASSLSEIEVPQIEFSDHTAIKGNLFSDQFSETTTLQKLTSDAISRLGSTQVNMHNSSIVFKQRLLVNHIKMRSIDTSKLVQKQSSNSMEYANVVRKQFKRLIISSNIIMPLAGMVIKILNLNEHFALQNHLSTLITTLNDEESATVFVGVCSASFIETTTATPYVNTVIQNAFYRVHEQKQQLEIVIIDSIARFQHTMLSKNIQHIFIFNGLSFDAYLSHIVLPSAETTNPSRKTLEISGEKSFLSDFYMVFAHILEINKRIETRNWLENGFRQQKSDMYAQQIVNSRGWQFIDVTSDGCWMENEVNDVLVVSSKNNNDRTSSKNIIFIDDQTQNTLIIIVSDIIANNAKINTMQTTVLRPCDILQLNSRTVDLMHRFWYEINVFGNVKVVYENEKHRRLNTSSCSPLCFFQKALSTESNENIETNVLNLKDIHGKFSFNQIINNVDINHIDVQSIVLDAVFTSSDVVGTTEKTTKISFTALKKFSGTSSTSIAFRAKDTYLSTNGFEVNLLNEINVNALNQTLLYKQSTSKEIFVRAWQKFLFFEAPVMKYIDVKSMINDVNVSAILFAYLNQSSSVQFIRNTQQKCQIAYVDFLNGISLDYFIDNRMVLQQTSKPQRSNNYYNIENLILTGEQGKIEQINFISVDEVVLKQSNEKQFITGDKLLLGELLLVKPFHAWKTNNIEIVANFGKTFNRGHKQLIERIRLPSAAVQQSILTSRLLRLDDIRNDG